MAAWLLQGAAPRQLGRECHKPLLYATAADPAGLLVCGLMAGELERGIKPGGWKGLRGMRHLFFDALSRLLHVGG
jgi:hypothetical protein